MKQIKILQKYNKNVNEKLKKYRQNKYFVINN